jgi:hypothetical protein
MLLDFYMPLSSTARTPQFFIIPQHQPPISYIDLNNYSAKSLAQRSSLTTSLVIWKLQQQENCIPTRTYRLSPSYCLLFLPPTIHSTNLLQCSCSLPHPSFDATPILHNTQTNKVAYPCIPCNCNRISFHCKCAKSWQPLTTIKQKNETLKPVAFTLLEWFFVWSQGPLTPTPVALCFF